MTIIVKGLGVILQVRRAEISVKAIRLEFGFIPFLLKIVFLLRRENFINIAVSELKTH